VLYFNTKHQALFSAAGFYSRLMQSQMKNYNLLLFVFVVGLVSCEKSENNGNNPYIPVYDTLPSEVFIKIADNFTYNYSDVAFYDSSAHIVYFLESHPELEKIREAYFEVYAERDTVYRGELWPSYSSSLPAGIYIPCMPLFYQNYALGFENRLKGMSDLRNDPRLISNLYKRKLLHSGIVASVDEIQISGSLARLSFVVTNYDETPLFILDPDKMGHKLFHYFTNGLYLVNKINNVVTTTKLESQTPVPFNGWSKEWLTLLSPGESSMFTLNYSFDSVIPPGDYTAWFEYPGLSLQVDIDELFQVTGRIWLGSVKCAKYVNVL